MDLALEQADLAAQRGEVPIGAVLVSHEGTILSAEGNNSIAENDPTAHAEVACLRQAARKVGNYRLTETIMVVTLEPCLMCLGAMVHARISGLVYGAADPKAGVIESCINGPELPFLNHTFACLGGIKADECGERLRTFFRSRRKKTTQPPLTK